MALENLIDKKFVEEEDVRVLTMVTALYVSHLHPDLTLDEVFSKLEDVEFVKGVIVTLLEEIYGDKSMEVLHRMPEAHSVDSET